VREFLQGRRLGFAPRPAFGHLALGIGIAATVLDLMAWFAWGSAETNGFVIGAYWLVVATLVVALVALLTGLAEHADVDDAERALARLDLAAILGAIALYTASALLRAGDLGAAAVAPAALFTAGGGLLVLLADAGLAGNLYAAREWEELEEELPRDRRPRRHVAGR
jgi:uncharacterized membrane protein